MAAASLLLMVLVYLPVLVSIAAGTAGASL